MTGGKLATAAATDGFLFFGYLHDRGQRIAVIEAHNLHALRVAPDDVDLFRRHALDLAAGGHHQQFILVTNWQHADHAAVALAGLDVDQPRTAAALGAIRTAAIGLVSTFGFRFGRIGQVGFRSSLGCAVSVFAFVDFRQRCQNFAAPNQVRLP